MTTEILVSAEEIRITQYVVTASVVLMIYDWLVTIGDESNLIWNSKRSSTKLLFFATRYLGFIVSASVLVYTFGLDLDANCGQIAKIYVYSALSNVVVAEVIMSLRVVALWGGSRRIQYLLVFLFLADVVIAVITVIRLDYPVYDLPVEGLSSCTNFHLNTRYSCMFFSLLMTFECVIILLTFWKGVSHWREDVHTGTLFMVFYRDGALYFLFLFALSTANFIIWLRERPATAVYYFILVEPQRVFHSVLTARIILNLRETVARRQDSASLSNIDFLCEDISRAESSGRPYDGTNDSEIEMNQLHVPRTAYCSSRIPTSCFTGQELR